MKLTDYVAEFIAEQGIKHVFGLTGGAVVHLFDSVDRHPKLMPVFTHHEQAAALAAEAYSRINENLGAAVFTTGPGGTNAITGVAAAWLDSIPCLYISGQTRLEHTSQGKPVRQIGTQHLEIIPLVSPITKYAVMIDDPKMIQYHLQKAVYLAKTGRPGPVWIDIPLNFHWASIEPDNIPTFNAPNDNDKAANSNDLKLAIEKCVELIAEAKRPLILLGHGTRLAHASEEFKEFIKKLKIPFVSSWNASDILPTDEPLYIGRIGFAGQRGANLAIQNCDLLICIGTHLSIQLTGTNYETFAREAKIVVVNIDQPQMENLTVKIDLPIIADTKAFLTALLAKDISVKSSDLDFWLTKCSAYKQYNEIPSEWGKKKDFVDPYVLVDQVSDELRSDDVVVVDGGGTVVYTTFQALKVKQGERVIISSGLCAMGTGLPESIGACFASNRKRTICFVGDGSMQLNIQELQTIFHHNLPIKIFVFNNEGYLAIRHTQKGFLNSSYIGSDKSGGLSLPDFVKVAETYGIKAMRISNNQEISAKIKAALEQPGPVVCEIMISREQEVIPRQGFYPRGDGASAAMPLEDMEPYLDRKEFLGNMLVKPWGGK